MTDFDITKHEWSAESNIEHVEEDLDENVCIDFDMELSHTYFQKSDAIALAKHFKLTPEDLC